MFLLQYRSGFVGSTILITAKAQYRYSKYDKSDDEGNQRIPTRCFGCSRGKRLIGWTLYQHIVEAFQKRLVKWNYTPTPPFV